MPACLFHSENPLLLASLEESGKKMFLVINRQKLPALPLEVLGQLRNTFLKCYVLMLQQDINID